jgi:diguanylate cyclase (GGDEF)-like protein
MKMGKALMGPESRVGLSRFADARLAVLSWIGLIVIIALILPLRLDPAQNPAVWWSAGWLVMLALYGSLGLWLARIHSRWAVPWQFVMVTGALCAANANVNHTSLVWPLFPMSAVISLMFFPRAVARWHTLLLSVMLIITGSFAFLSACIEAVFTVVLVFVIERMRRRENQLVAEVTTRAAQNEAITAISWSLTSLVPAQDDIRTILTSACPPDVSLVLMLLRDNSLVPEAAVGPDAEAMLRWHYPLRAESSSMVAQALRECRTLTVTIGGNDAELLLNGALPETPLPLRSAVALPIMRQGAEPLGVLLAISSNAEALGDHRLGILPVVANQFAVALENARLFEEAQGRADHDALTGLLHHRAIHARLHEEIQRASRSARPFALLLLDLDDFRRYNEIYGHSVGDAILTQTARLLSRSLRAGDILGRLGGDEFLAILPDTDPGEAVHLARTLLTAFSAESIHHHLGGCGAVPQ